MKHPEKKSLNIKNNDLNLGITLPATAYQDQLMDQAEIDGLVITLKHNI